MPTLVLPFTDAGSWGVKNNRSEVLNCAVRLAMQHDHSGLEEF
jgi:hypothetical protein